MFTFFTGSSFGLCLNAVFCGPGFGSILFFFIIVTYLSKILRFAGDNSFSACFAWKVSRREEKGQVLATCEVSRGFRSFSRFRSGIFLGILCVHLIVSSLFPS